MKTIPWGHEAAPREVSMPETNTRGGYSVFSAGPLVDPTPHEDYPPMTALDSYQMSEYGPPYETTKE
jgi:hypothetical protein